MDAVHLLGQTGDGFDTDTAAVLLVTCNVLVVVMFVAAYWISIRHSGSGDAELAGHTQIMGNLAQEPAAPYRRMADDAAASE